MRKALKSAIALAVALTTGYGVYTLQQETEMSELVLANVEALAQSESDLSNSIWNREDYVLDNGTPQRIAGLVGVQIVF